jgi:hypothetical protein
MKIDDMNSSDARAILAQIPCDFNGGEICTSVGTLHNEHVLQHVDCRYSTNSESILVLNNEAILAQNTCDFYAGKYCCIVAVQGHFNEIETL